MKPELKELIEEGVVSEIEVIEFLSTLKKLSANNVIPDNDNFKLAIDNFGFEESDDWIKIDEDTSYKI
jgi:hypothetical protein